MLTIELAQKILDHFHVGKIQTFNYCVFYYEAKTNKGIFYILQDDPFTARETETKRSQKLEELVGKIERQLLPDYKGELQAFSSYAHKQGKYFSVYKKQS